MEALSTKIHQQQAAAVAISQAFDNLAKAAAQVRHVCDSLPEKQTNVSVQNQSMTPTEVFTLRQQQKYLFNEKRLWEQVERRGTNNRDERRRVFAFA